MRNASLLAVVLIGVAGAAGPARAAVLSKIQVKGNTASTQFFASVAITRPDGISSGTFSADGSILGSASVSKVKGGPREIPNDVLVDVSISNSCTGESRFVSGMIPGGFDPPNNNLTSAAMTGTTELEDFGDGPPLVFSVDLHVAGQGPLTSFQSNSHSRNIDTGGGTLLSSYTRTSSATRSGVGTGTLSIAGLSLTPTFVSTELTRDDLGQVVLERRSVAAAPTG